MEHKTINTYRVHRMGVQGTQDGGTGYIRWGYRVHTMGVRVHRMYVYGTQDGGARYIGWGYKVHRMGVWYIGWGYGTQDGGARYIGWGYGTQDGVQGTQNGGMAHMMGVQGTQDGGTGYIGWGYKVHMMGVQGTQDGVQGTQDGVRVHRMYVNGTQDGVTQDVRVWVHRMIGWCPKIKPTWKYWNLVFSFCRSSALCIYKADDKRLITRGGGGGGHIRLTYVGTRLGLSQPNVTAKLALGGIMLSCYKVPYGI